MMPDALHIQLGWWRLAVAAEAEKSTDMLIWVQLQDTQLGVFE